MSVETLKLVNISAELLTQAINRKKADEIESATIEYRMWRLMFKQERDEYRKKKAMKFEINKSNS